MNNAWYSLDNGFLTINGASTELNADVSAAIPVGEGLAVIINKFLDGSAGTPEDNVFL